MSDPYGKRSVFHTDAERDYYAWVGLYIATFSAVESSILNLLNTLYKFFDVSEVETERPIALKRRLKLLRKIANNHADARSEKQQIDLICANVLTESEFRHDLIHGQNYMRFKIDDENEYYKIMVRPETHAGAWPEKGTRVTEDLLRKKYDELGALMFGLMGVNRRLMLLVERKLAVELAALEKLHNVLREIHKDSIGALPSSDQDA